MKKRNIIPGILIVFVSTAISYAVVINSEPPVNYINNLKTCTKGIFRINNELVEEYEIKGKLPNGRCEVNINQYKNYSNPKVYENYKIKQRTFDSSSNTNTYKRPIEAQTQMIEQAKREKLITECSFSNNELDELYKAYQNKTSGAYNKLMEKYDNQSCASYKIGEYYLKRPIAKYICEYADTACYYTGYNNNRHFIKCTEDHGQIANPEKRYKIIHEHVEKGLCSKI